MTGSYKKKMYDWFEEQGWESLIQMGIKSFVCWAYIYGFCKPVYFLVLRP